MKKLTVLFFSILMIMLGSVVSYATDSLKATTVIEGKVGRGEEFTVLMTVDSAEEINGVIANLVYPDDKIEFTGTEDPNNRNKSTKNFYDVSAYMSDESAEKKEIKSGMEIILMANSSTKLSKLECEFKFKVINNEDFVGDDIEIKLGRIENDEFTNKINVIDYNLAITECELNTVTLEVNDLEISAKVNSSNENLTYEINNNMLSNVQPLTSVDSLKANIDSNATTVVVKNKNEEEVSSGDIVSGMTITYTFKRNDYETSKTYTIAVRGDINGDGKATIIDIFGINSYRFRFKKLEGVFLKAADANEDGSADLLDIFAINTYRLGIKDIIEYKN